MEGITKTEKMNGLKNYAIGSPGTLGAMEIVDAQLLSTRETDSQTLLIRSVISLLVVTNVLLFVVSLLFYNAFILLLITFLFLFLVCIATIVTSPCTFA